jgi:hypothetical protein
MLQVVSLVRLAMPWDKPNVSRFAHTATKMSHGDHQRLLGAASMNQRNAAFSSTFRHLPNELVWAVQHARHQTHDICGRKETTDVSSWVCGSSVASLDQRSAGVPALSVPVTRLRTPILSKRRPVLASWSRCGLRVPKGQIEERIVIQVRSARLETFDMHS